MLKLVYESQAWMNVTVLIQLIAYSIYVAVC